jgi:hypothetical protein
MNNKTNALFFMLFFTLFFTLFFNQSASAQRFYGVQANSLDLTLGGDIGFRIINELNNSHTEILENRSALESFKLSYKFGLNYNIGLNSRLSIKTGFRYSNPGFDISRIERVDFSEGLNNIPKIIDHRGYSYKINYQFIGVPLGIRYTLSSRSCDPYIEAGFTPSLLLQTKVSEFDYQGNQSDNYNMDDNINDFNLFSFVNIGGNFIISDKLSGFTQLTSTLQVNNFRKDIFSEKLVQLGIEFGVRRILN